MLVRRSGRCLKCVEPVIESHSIPRGNGGSYVQHVELGEKLWFEKHNGFYVFHTPVAPSHKQSAKRMRHEISQDFGTQRVL